MPPSSVKMVDPDGVERDVPPKKVAAAVDSGWRMRTDADVRARLTSEAREADYGGVGGAVAAGGAALARGATVGLSDAAIAALGGSDTLRNLREVNPGVSTAGEIAGAVAPTLLSGGTGAAASVARLAPAARVAELGASIGRAAEGAGVLARVGAAGLGGAVEGAIVGAGTGVSELALSRDPLDYERAAQVLSSHALYGAGVGAAAGSVAKLAEVGLAKARTVLESAAEAKPVRAGEVADDLAGMDVKQLAAAERAEVEGIEAARVPVRKQLAEDLNAFRRATKANKEFLATAELEMPGIGERLGAKELGRKGIKATKALDNLLDDPKLVAQKPEVALKALRLQEDYYVKLLDRADDLRAAYVKEAETAGAAGVAAGKATQGSRAAALDTIEGSLAKNRTLQEQIEGVAAAPRSARMTAIQDAKLAAQTPAPPKSIGEQIAGGVVFGKVAALAGAVPFLGGVLGPLMGARASALISEKVFGRMGTAIAASRARSAKAVASFFGAAEKGTRAAPVLATRVLSSVAFAPPGGAPPGAADPAPADQPRTGAGDELADLFRKRSAELRSQIAVGPDGRAQMRPEARAQIADRLRPIAALNPHFADGLETIAARRAEFLFDKMPKRPAVDGLPLGPDLWQPSRMQLAEWARYVAAVEDPDAIVERMVDGSVTPEDDEAMREVYPEKYAELQRQMFEALPTLRKQLPYHRRLAWSVFARMPVDASLDPRVLNVLQDVYKAEPGTDGGVQAPKPAPQFGSVRAEEPTQAQTRAQGATTR